MFACSDCGQAFTRADNLFRHRREKCCRPNLGHPSTSGKLNNYCFDVCALSDLVSADDPMNSSVVTGEGPSSAKRRGVRGSDDGEGPSSTKRRRERGSNHGEEGFFAVYADVNKSLVLQRLELPLRRDTATCVTKTFPDMVSLDM